MKRRKFLANGSKVVALPIILQGLHMQAFGEGIMSDEEYTSLVQNDHILVIIQMAGGNDGLNTVVPLDQYSKYFNARSNIAIRESKILKLPDNPGVGLHPAMTGMHEMYKNGNLCIVQAVGYPDPSMSHFRDTDIWHTASHRNEILKDGWIGRFLKEEFSGYPANYPNETMRDPLAIEFGSIASLGLLSNGVHMGYTISNPDSIVGDHSSGDVNTPDTPFGDRLRYLRQVSTQANKYSSSIRNAYYAGRNYVNYSTENYYNNDLADNLKLIARLIEGGLQTKIYIVKMTGFDTHFFQSDGADNVGGVHASLLKDLSSSVKSFQDDLKIAGNANKVIGMTVSEFGRRIKSNASKGTDHGTGAPLFLFGEQVTPGVIGKNPTIPDNPGVWETVPFQNDFRSVYLSLLKRWFCQDSSSINNVLYRNFTELNIVNNSNCSTLSAPQATQDNQFFTQTPTFISVYPNPVVSNTVVECKVQQQGYVLVQLLSAEGNVLRRLYENSHQPVGNLQVSVNLSGLNLGKYHIRFQSGSYVELKGIMKVK